MAHQQTANSQQPTAAGFTLIEMIFYVVLFTLLFGVIVQALLTISGTHREIAAIKNINNSASLAMERMVRDIRDADHVITSESSLATSSGVLTLALTSNNSETRTFEYNNNQVQLSKNGISQGSLTGSQVTVNDLIFHHITSGTSTAAVRITLDVEVQEQDVTKQRTFYDTAILRNAYK